MQALEAAALSRLAALDLAQKERTSDQLGCGRQEIGEAADLLNGRIEIDQRVPPAAAPRYGPIVGLAGVEGLAQFARQIGANRTAQQQAAVTQEDGSAVTVQPPDAGRFQKVSHRVHLTPVRARRPAVEAAQAAAAAASARSVRTAFMVCSRAVRLIGLPTCPSIPASRQRATSWAVTSAVMATMGVREASPFRARMARAAE